MPTNIENNVVSMSFDNSNFERNAKTTMNTLDKLKKTLNFSGTAKSFNDISAAAGGVNLNPLQNGVQEVSNRFSALQVVGVTALATITNQAVNAGLNITRALTLDSVFAGFQEYELKMNSVQTIMAGTGKSLKEVMAALNDLNTYADKTIYVFSDMTQNIGKFTNAGVDLDTAVKAMKGLSNEAALSGASAMEASRAMYNIAQSLSMGYMQYIDWKSIENANMATKEFKEQLVATALDMGTLTEAAVEAEPSINALFKDKLKDGWLTNDVLLATLEKYSDETTDLGRRAFAAAQDIKTFSQMFDTLREAAGSGWAQTFEYIFGDFEQAKVLWTAVGTTIGNVISDNAKARNDLLKTWNETGGREYFINGLVEQFKALTSILKVAGQAWKVVFGDMALDSSKLHDLSASFFYFSQRIKEGVQPVLGDIKQTFLGLFSVLDIGWQAVSALGRAFKYLIEESGIGELAKTVLGVTGSLGLFVSEVDKDIKSSDIFYKVLKGVADVLLLIPRGINAVSESITGHGILDLIGNAASHLKDLYTTLKNLASGVMTGVSNNAKQLHVSFEGLGTIGDILTGVFTGFLMVLESIGSVILKVVNGINETITNAAGQTGMGTTMDFINTAGLAGALSAFILQIKNLMDPIGDIGDMITNIREDLAILQVAIRADAILKIAEAVALLAVSCVMLASIDSDKLAASLGMITAFVVELSGAFAIFNKLTATPILAETFTGPLAGLKGAVQGITNIKNALLSITDAISKNMMASVFVKLATSVLLLAVAMKMISDIDGAAMARSLGVITVLIGEMTAAGIAISRFSGDKAVKGFLGMANAILVLSVALKVIASIKPEQMVNSLAVMTSSLLAMTISLKVLGSMDSGGLVAAGAAMLIAANGILVLSAALKVMSTISLSEMAIAVGGLVVSLAALTTALLFMNQSLPGAGAMLIAANGILVLSAGIKVLSTIPLANMAIAVGGLAVTLGALTIALNAMVGAIPGAAALIIAAGAIAILAPSLALLSAIPFTSLILAITGLAIAIGVLGGASILLSGLIVPMASLAGVLALFGGAAFLVGAAVLALSAGLATLAVSGVAGATALIGVLSVILGGIPMIVNAIGLFIWSVLNMIEQLSGKIFEAATVIIIGVCDTLIACVPKIIETAFVLIMSFLIAIRDHVGEMTTIAVDIVVNFINAIAANMNKIVNAAFNLIISFINGLATAIDTHASDIRDAMFNLGESILSAILQFFGLDRGEAHQFIDVGKDLINGIINGVKSKITDAVNTVKDVGSKMLKGLKDVLGIHSPSREGFSIGAFVDDGVIGGLDSKRKKVLQAAVGVANSVISGLTDTLSDVESDIDAEFNFAPVVKPMIDLSGIQNGASRISDILNRSSYDKLVTVRDEREARKLQREVGVSGGTTVVNNVNINQRNESPKPINSYELYRNNKKLEKMIQGVLT